jgi:hypothetical protein
MHPKNFAEEKRIIWLSGSVSDPGPDPGRPNNGQKKGKN